MFSLMHVALSFISKLLIRAEPIEDNLFAKKWMLSVVLPYRLLFPVLILLSSSLTIGEFKLVAPASLITGLLLSIFDEPLKLSFLAIKRFSVSEVNVEEG